LQDVYGKSVKPFLGKSAKWFLLPSVLHQFFFSHHSGKILKILRDTYGFYADWSRLLSAGSPFL
jgi:hypothetical protein